METETVTRLRAATRTDRYGETIADWSLAADELPIRTLTPAEPRPSAEPMQDARNAVTSGWTLYLPLDADVRSSDRVRVRGVAYAVLGQPARWIAGGLVVQCDLVEG